MIWLWVLRLGRSCHTLITEADNKTVSVFRVAAIIISAHMCGLQFVDTVMNNHPFAAQDFGLGIAALWAAVGLGERVTHYQEHGSPPNDVAG